MTWQCTLRHFSVSYQYKEDRPCHQFELYLVKDVNSALALKTAWRLFVFILILGQVISRLMGRSSRMSFNLCSGVKTTPIIWRSQSLTCLSVWLGRKWIRTSRDEVCLSPGHQEPRWQGRPISRHYQSNIFPHTGVEWSEWTGSLAPVSIHIITSVGGSLENSQVITDCLSPLSSLRKISNFVIIIFGAWLASTLSNPPQPLLGKTKTEETLMILSFLSSSVEHNGTGSLLTLSLLSSTSSSHLLSVQPVGARTQSLRSRLRVWGRDYKSRDEACQQSTEMSSHSFYSVPAVPQHLKRFATARLPLPV